MSQLPEQLLKSSNMNIGVQMDQNINMINSIPLGQYIPNQSNLPMNQGLQMGIPLPEPKNSQNPVDTSKLLIKSK
jgi:hypothetical protein